MNDVYYDEVQKRWRVKWTDSVTCGTRWIAEIELCPRCGLDAAAHIKELGDGPEAHDVTVR